MSIQLTFEIRLLSDYHVGAGQRAGMTVDSALLRDHDSAPVLRGTMLSGLLRDGLSDLQSLLNRNNNISPQRPIDEDTFRRLFGEPKRRKRWTYSSARPHEILPDKQRWGSRDIARVRLNPRTRRVAPQQLFFQEEGDARLRFRFTASCVADTAANQADAALLVAAARMVRHLGAARRRGRGRCSIHLVSAEGLQGLDDSSTWDTEKALQLFKELWLEGTVEREIEATGPAEIAPQSMEFSGQYRRFRLTAQLLEPVVVAQRSQAANAFETLPVIPGTAVLGALATRAAYKLGIYRDNAYSPPAEFTQLFLRGGLSVSSLIPAVIELDNEELPDKLSPAVSAPKSLFQCENYPAYTNAGDKEQSPHPVYNGLRQALPKGCQQALPSGQICGGKLKSVGGFTKVHKDKERYTPAKREEVHIYMDRETERVREGLLYEYIALEAGQWFVGELLCDSSAWKGAQQLLDLQTDQRLTLRLGKATQRGYGLAHFVLEELKEEAPTFILEPFDERVRVNGNSLDVSMLLLTDTIVTDPWGRFYLGFDAGWLAKEMGVPTTALTIINDRQFTSSRIVDTFNTYRRMPRWRDEAIEAGSAVSLRISCNSQEEVEKVLARLRRLEVEGVGLRRNEGFGRIAFNHPLLAEEVPSFSEEIDAHEIYSLLYPTPGSLHALQIEAEFRREWQERLTNKAWDGKIKAAYEPVARLLFLYRHLPPSELKQWLALDKNGRPQALLKSENLWGNKELLAADKEPRLDAEGMSFIVQLVDELEQEVAHRPGELWPIGLELLADRIAEEAGIKQGDEA